MHTVINIACIRRGGLLLVFKRDVWILPGGKIEGDESDMDCLIREVGEELPHAKICNLKAYGNFEGTTPHTGLPVTVKVFLGKVTGNITPAAEISEADFFGKLSLGEMTLSPITSRIIDSLIRDKLL